MQWIRRDVRRTEVRSRSGVVARYAVAGLASVVLAVSASWGFDEGNAEAPEGLVGIFPEFIPEGLTPEAFAALDGNWAEWSAQTAQAVERFYTEPGNLASQQAQLAVLKSKRNVMATALEDNRYRSLHEPLAALHNRLSREIELAEAVLATLQLDPQQARRSRLTRTRAAVFSALDRLAADLNTIPGGSAWLAYVHAPELRQAAGSGGAELDQRLQSVQNRLNRQQEALNPAQQDFLNRPAFRGFEQAIGQYLQAANAAQQPFNQAELRNQLQQLVGALATYREDASSSAAAAAREAYAALKALAPDGAARLSEVMRTYFVNYNLRVVAAEPFLNRFAAKRRTDHGGVRDFVLGASVSGSQASVTDVALDLKPSARTIRFDITLNGTVQSNTAGVTEQATIFTSGYHRFFAAKEINFDGDGFWTEPARISVSANNTTTGARTNISRLPILGSIADRYAMGEARERRGQSEAIAAGRIQARVLPEFNAEVNTQFANATRELQQGLNARLKDMNLFPSARSYSSTEHQIRVNTRLMGEAELGGGAPLRHINPTNSLVAQVHETLINNSLDRMDIRGQTMSEEDFKIRLENHISGLLGREFHFSQDETDTGPTDPSTFLFAEQDPIRVRVTDGSLVLIIRTGLRREGEEDIPTQEITVPLTFTVAGNDIVVESGNVGVAPVGRPENLTRQIAAAGVMRKKIQATLPTRRFDRQFTVTPDDSEPLNLSVTNVTPLGGWLVVEVQ